MDTQLGRAFNSEWKRGCAATAAFVVVVADWFVVAYGPDALSWTSVGLRFGVGAIGVGLLLALAKGDLASVGIRFRVAPSWAYWILATLIVAAALGAVLGVTFFVLYQRGVNIFAQTIPPERALRAVLLNGTVWPAVEEPIYRLVLCVALIRWLGRWGAVVISGAAFAWLHFGVYDTAQVNNVIAGFVLAWAFVRSESIVIPLLWHGLGNAAVILWFVVSWYVQNG